MLYLKKINYEDWEEEFIAISKIPANENGFANKYYGVSVEKFKINYWQIQKERNYLKGEFLRHIFSFGMRIK